MNTTYYDWLWLATRFRLAKWKSSSNKNLYCIVMKWVEFLTNYILYISSTFYHYIFICFLLFWECPFYWNNYRGKQVEKNYFENFYDIVWIVFHTSWQSDLESHINCCHVMLLVSVVTLCYFFEIVTYREKLYVIQWIQRMKLHSLEIFIWLCMQRKRFQIRISKLH